MKTTLRTLFFSGLLFSGISVSAQTVKTGLFFEQTGSYVRIPHNSAYDFGNGPFTLEMWIQADTGQEYNPFLLHKKDTVTNATGFGLAIDNNDKLTLQIAGIGYNTGFGFGGTPIVDGNCHHIVYTRDVSGAADTVRAYIDGNLIKKSVKDAASANVDHGADLYVGWIRGGSFKKDFTYHGMIKELRMWNIARDEASIQETMDKFLEGDEAGLVGNWRFYENSGTSVEDFSSIGNDGVLGGGSYTPTWQDFCDVIDDDLPQQPSGIEHTENGRFSIYPNPADHRISVQVAGGQVITRLRIYNALGAVVLEDQQPTVNNIDISGMKEGLYFTEVSFASGEVATQRFVKK